MSSYRYRVVDVFTENPLEGNPLAVFPDAPQVDEATMQRIARELNLSETVFVFPSNRNDCAATLRIFTPTRELAFAGHPTIGTSFVLLDEGRVRRDSESFQLDEKIGVVPIRVEHKKRPLIWLTSPPIRFGETYDSALCTKALGLNSQDLMGITPQIVTAGNPTLFIAVKDMATVDRAWLDMSGVALIKSNKETEAILVFVFTPVANGAYSRMFGPEYGVVEDPATGSATGPLAAFMMKHQLAPSNSGASFTSEQGTKMGRRSILHIRIRGKEGKEGIEIGGYVTPLIEATMTL